MNKKKIVFDYISKQNLAVLSTVNAVNHPESAVLEFGETESLELVFDTFNSARKYKNLKNNSNVSFVIGWDENITVQYSGKAEELFAEEKESYKKVYFSKNPDARRWENKKGMAYFKVTPSWIRYSDLNKDPWEIFEITF